MSWITVRVLATAERDSIVALLISEGASCIQEDGDFLVTSFPEGELPKNLESRIASVNPAATIAMSRLAEQTYDLHGSVTARQIGNLFVAPPWDSASSPADKTIIIEPGGAFGTGDHETTRGVLALMQGVIRMDDVVADLGAGSAVLSIAAAKLGASRVAAVELDHDAIANAEENVAANGVGAVVSVIEGDAELILPLLAPVKLILANIVSGVLIGLLPLMARCISSGGHAILSGILLSERDQMMRSFAETGWRLDREIAEGEWWSALISKQ